MKSIKKKNGNVWMIGSFLIVLVLFLLLLSKTPRIITKDLISLNEAVTMIEALNDDAQKEILFEKFKNQYGNDTEEKEDMTYELMKETLDILDSTGKFSAQMLDNVPKDKYVERDTFFSLYEKMIDELGKENEILLEKVSILGLSEEEDETFLVSLSGTGICERSLFEKYQGYVAEVYVKRNQSETRYIVVKNLTGESMEIPYVYAKGQDGEGIHFRYKEKDIIMACKNGIEVSNDSVVTLHIDEGQIVSAKEYDEKINGKVLAVNETYVTLDNLGKYEFVENMKIYKVFEGLSEGTIADVALGYEFVDFVMDNEKVCACLIVANEGMENIRVLIKTTDFASNYHETAKVTCDFPYTIYKNGVEYKKCDALEEVFISDTDLTTDDYFKIVPDVLSGKIILKSVKRNQGIPAYSGVMEIHKKEEGLVLINELLLEEYLYTVVPSEMPSYYHEQALKAQAVCARTYAYSKMKNAGLKALGAHLDDSTSFQVYNNIDAQVSTTNAVRETVGQILSNDGAVMETMYYSTSCGLSATGLKLNRKDDSQAGITTNEEFKDFISDTDMSDYEVQESFYRWNYSTSLDTQVLEKRVKECYNRSKNYVLYLDNLSQFIVKDAFEDVGFVTDILVVERSAGGRAEKLLLRGSENSVMICGEYQIRYVLLNEDNVINKQDGTTTTMSTLLPSAFVDIEYSQQDGKITEYQVTGGGYGHGNGMSQNGAGNMAKDGYSYTDILMTFYENCNVEKIY